MTSLWRNVSVNVVANSNWSCLLISGPKVHWRVQPTAARRSGIFSKMHVALRTLHVSVKTASMRTVSKCLKRNNDHLITLQIRMERRYHVWGATHEAILKSSSEAKNSFWIKSRTGEDMGQFSAGPTNKAVQSFTSNLTRVRERWGRHSKHLSLLRKGFALTAFALSWIVETIFDNVSTAKLPWLKAA